MHEYSIVGALMERVEIEAAAHGAGAVRRLRVGIGELSGVEAELLATAFETFRAGGICSDAVLEIRTVEARWECPRCAAGISRGQILRCPSCHAPARLAQGDEIVLDQIEMEVAS